MKCAVWYTGHPICDTVAKSLARGFNGTLHHVGECNDDIVRHYDVHIAYGILRGTSKVFAACEKLGIHWFNVDNGYFGPGHFAGNYRISYRSTQCKWDKAKHPLASLVGRVLIAPPTQPVCEFYNIDPVKWHYWAKHQCDELPYTIREKGDAHPINWDDYDSVLTFNSGVGWTGLLRGKVVHSDPLHSVVGSYFDTKSIALPNNDDINNQSLVELMNEHQFTLNEIERGDAWRILIKYLNG